MIRREKEDIPTSAPGTQSQRERIPGMKGKLVLVVHVF